MQRNLIGVTGKAGAGKDTVGTWLIINQFYRRYAMADALKRGMAAMGFPEPLVRENKEKPIEGFDFTWRQAAQSLGTEWGRRLDENIWLKIAERDIANIFGNVVITDIRFENEAAMVRRLGGQVWHIVGRQADLGESQTHQSEAGVMFYPDKDLLIDNRGSLDELHVKLEGIFNV